MKLLHLSDLHIGKRVNEVSMIEDQEYILTQIIRIIDEEKLLEEELAGYAQYKEKVKYRMIPLIW